MHFIWELGIEHIGNSRQIGNHEQIGDVSQTAGNSHSGGTVSAHSIVAGDIALESHTHGGVETGSGKTGKPGT